MITSLQWIMSVTIKLISGEVYMGNKTYENLFVAYFSINGRFCLVSLKNPTFSNIFPRAKHVLMTFEFWTLCACLSIFSLYISHLLLSSQQAPIDMGTISYPSPDDGYWNRNVNVDFTLWYIHLFGLYFFLQPSYIYIYIWFVNFVDSILSESEFICFHTVKWFQVYLSNANNSIWYL